MFNADPKIQAVAITPRQTCYVIDDALADPDALVELAVAQRAGFADLPGNAFPGPELVLAAARTDQVRAFFDRHVRALLGGETTLQATARLSLVTRAPDQLQPRQCICHVDRLDLAPGQLATAAVLYLFDDPALGGTAFYMPKRPMPEVLALFRDAATMDATRFEARHGIARGYMTGSNRWFRKVGSVPARRNRMIFYSGTMLHSGEIRHPERLDPDPRRGRLTLNAFLTCARNVGATNVSMA